MGRRLADCFLEHPVEVRERLEADLEGDFTHPQIGVEQEVLGSLDADARDVIREVQARRLLEDLAEVERASVDRFGNLPETHGVGLVFYNVCLGPRDDGRLRVLVRSEEHTSELQSL